MRLVLASLNSFLLREMRPKFSGCMGEAIRCKIICHMPARRAQTTFVVLVFCLNIKNMNILLCNVKLIFIIMVNNLDDIQTVMCSIDAIKNGQHFGKHFSQNLPRSIIPTSIFAL